MKGILCLFSDAQVEVAAEIYFRHDAAGLRRTANRIICVFTGLGNGFALMQRNS